MDPQLVMLISAIINRVRNFPDDAFNELFVAMDAIDEKYGLVEELSEADLAAIDQGQADIDAGKLVSSEEVAAVLAKYRTDYDADADGKEAFQDAVALVTKLPGTEQGGVADVLFTLLDKPRFDVPPHPED